MIQFRLDPLSMLVGAGLTVLVLASIGPITFDDLLLVCFLGLWLFAIVNSFVLASKRPRGHRWGWITTGTLLLVPAVGLLLDRMPSNLRPW
jgi:hypothetical protein